MFLRRFFASFSSKVTTMKEFKEKVQIPASKPILVDFYADWCGPCKVLDPVISKYCEKNNVDLVKVDVDDGIEVAQEYSDGQLKDKFIGVKDEKGLESFVKKSIAN